MKYVYPVIFTPEEGTILVSVPDLPGLDTFAVNVTDALYMARDAIEMWLWDAENKGEAIPPASDQTAIAKLCESQNQSVSMVSADTDEYRRQNDPCLVNSTRPIPA
jgi:predicted RNase H-like HicB family nuclease